MEVSAGLAAGLQDETPIAQRRQIAHVREVSS